MTGSREVSAIQFGRLMSSVETLVATMTSIQQDLSDQRGINSRLEQQLSQSELHIGELKTLINGPDGSSGLLARLTSLEAKLGQTTEGVKGLQKTFADTKSTVFKLALIIGASASAGTAGVSKVLSLLAP